MKPIITFLCTVLLTIASQVSGQNMSTSFTATPATPPYPVSSQVTVDLNVTNFTNISSVLLPIAYNSAVLRFDSIDRPVMPGYIDTTLSFHPNPGVIKITWFPSLIDFPNGVTVAGTNARLLTLHFTVIGAGVSSVNLSTTVPFTPIEVVNAMGNVVFNNTIFQSSGSNGNGVSIGTPPPPTPLVGFKIIGNDVYAKQGNRVCVPITVNDFDGIQVMQYAMHWDNTKLTYDCVRGTTAPIIPTFNPPAAAPGTLLLQWEDPNLLSGVGVTKPDGTRIYEVCFNTIGAPGTQTNITIDGFGFGFPPDFTNDFAEATNASGNNVWTTGGANGASGVNSKVFIMTNPPAGTPVTYTADQDVVAPNAVTCVDVKVKNFTAINEAEFLMTYDATKLAFVSPVTIPATALNLIAANVVHSVAGNTGTIKFKWLNAAGATLADNTTIFSLCFTATGAAGSVVAINFGTSACPNPTPYATAKKDVGGVPYKFDNGQVTIMASGPPLPTLVASPALCATTATGSIQTNPNGTATAFAWAGPGINGTNINVEDPTGLTPGTYTVTVTYGATGTTTATATVTAPAAVSMTQTTVGVTCFGDLNGSIDITPAGGTAPYTYSWIGPMAFTATTQDISAVRTGNYVVTITDANQCTFASSAVNVSSPNAVSVPSNSIVITTVTCFGGANGAINIAPQGGTAPYTYDWSNDGPEAIDNDPQNIVGLMAGAYTVTVTDVRGCSFTPGTFTITAPPVLSSAFVKKEDVKCFDSPTGKAEITVSGGSGTKTFSWRTVPGNTPVSMVQNPTDLLPGTYNVIVTDGAGCTATTTLPLAITINNAPSALILSATTQPGQCFGEANGSIDLTANGGWGNYTYAWSSTLGNIADPNPVAPGTYTVTVTDQGLCAVTQTATVGGPQAAIAIGSPVVSHVTCFGQGNGGICLSLSGGNSNPFQVAWSNTPLTGACIGALPGGSYAPTVTDASGCTAVFAAIQVNSPTTINLDTTVTAADPTGGIDLTVSGGSPNYTFQWTGTSGPIAATEDISGMPAGTYTVQVTDANGCSKTGVYTIPSANVFNNPPTITSVTHSCNNDGCINISIPNSATSGSPFTLSWAGGSLPTSGSLTPSICGLSAGPYIVTITASNGNTATVTEVINQLQQALLGSSNTSQPFDDLKNGSITIQSTFPNCTFVWNTGSIAPALSNLDSGLYVVTVTNNTSGCTAVYQYTLVRQYQTYVVTVTEETDPSCATSVNGAIRLKVEGGDGPNYTYLWSGPNGFTATDKDIVGVAAGTYYVTITQENGVHNIHGPYVLAPASNLAITNVNELSLTPGGTQVSGADICDGVAAVVFSGQVGNTTILWNNGVTTLNNPTLCGGAYSVTVTDVLGCSAVWSDALTAPAAMDATNAPVAPKCFGEANGTAKVFVTGGIEPYDVEWSNGQFDQLVFANTFSEAVSLASGVYTVTVTDANLVEFYHTVIVPDAQQMQTSFTGVDPNSFNACDGERIAFVTGGEAPYNYIWNSTYKSGLTERAEGLCAGDVLIYNITDANGCSVSVVDSIPYPEDGCFLVRPVLTPAEQDGNNDFTLITCIESVANTVEIYNRWGQLVFQTEGYTNNYTDPEHTWTGYTRSGQSLPEGVYYYVLTYIDDLGNQHQLKGYINLLK
jgi:gliding motility-associated-like protein